MKHFIVLDFETTGLQAGIDEVLQVAAIDENGDTLLNELCKPLRVNKWPDAARIHGITPENAHDALADVQATLYCLNKMIASGVKLEELSAA